jgi:uncharacterized protein YjiS (DUF1127 family)
VLQFNVSSQSSILAVAAYKVVMFFENRSAAIAKWKEQRETFKSLHKLTDRELNDIGISRGDIRSIANDTWEENKMRDRSPVRMNSNLRGFV